MSGLSLTIFVLLIILSIAIVIFYVYLAWHNRGKFAMWWRVKVSWWGSRFILWYLRRELGPYDFSTGDKTTIEDEHFRYYWGITRLRPYDGVTPQTGEHHAR